jgi:hypothetical protein
VHGLEALVGELQQEARLADARVADDDVLEQVAVCCFCCLLFVVCCLLFVVCCLFLLSGFLMLFGGVSLFSTIWG